MNHHTLTRGTRKCLSCGYDEMQNGHIEFFPGERERICAMCFTWYLNVLSSLAHTVRTLRDEQESQL